MNIHEHPADKNGPTGSTEAWELEYTYAGLPDRLFSWVDAQPAHAPEMIAWNHTLAQQLGLSTEMDETRLAQVLSGSDAQSENGKLLAMAYSGHQFGQFNPGLGDGRAALLGEKIAQNGKRYDLQLKGSGPTPYSRMGDGRAAIGHCIREYVISEAMAALGIPTTRSLAIVATGQPIIRETLRPGAVLTRVAASHIRVGTFQHAAARGDQEALSALLDYAVQRHDPDLVESSDKALAFFRRVVERQASLIAKWMSVGFIHGVMNTDNMTVSGETIDYGPCAFMDHYDHGKVYSSIDQYGRYAYGAQPTIGKWNLARLAEALLLLFEDEDEQAVVKFTAALDAYDNAFSSAWLSAFAAKLGLAEASAEDRALIVEFLTLLQNSKTDFTNAFAGLSDALEGVAAAPVFSGVEAWPAWHKRWIERLKTEHHDGLPSARATMAAANPIYIPRNHLVEEAIEKAEIASDFGPFEKLVEVVRRPFERRDGLARYEQPPQDHEVVAATFCGT